MNSRDLQAALLELAGRELISSAEFERARDVRIGLLGITMAPGRPHARLTVGWGLVPIVVRGGCRLGCWCGPGWVGFSE